MATFNDPRLKTAFNQASSEIEGRQTNLDALSQDIKNLETYLNEQKCFHQVEVHLGVTDEPLAVDDFMIVESERLIFMEASLKNGRWRIFYQKVELDGVLENGLEGARVKVLESRPLIETPVEVRVRCKSLLPRLLRRAALASSSDPDALRVKWALPILAVGGKVSDADEFI